MENLSSKELRCTLDWLLELATCPVCHETLTPKVALCVRGHPVCQTCQQGLQKIECPMCRDAFSNVQPTGFIHQVIESLPHPCRHHGCDYFVKTKDDHERFCSYTTTKCRYCDWSGAAKEIIDHIQAAHSRQAKYLSPLALEYGMPFNLSEECSVFTPIYIFDHFFWGEMKNEPGAGKLTAIFHPVPNGKTTTQFKGSVKLMHKGFYSADININMDPAVDPYVENCVSVPTSILHKFTVKNNFEYRITVQISIMESLWNFVQSELESLMK